MEVTFITHDGQQFTVSAAEGQTMRDVAVELGIPGIVGSCGGGCACASCHVYVDAAWISKMTPRHDMIQAWPPAISVSSKLPRVHGWV